MVEADGKEELAATVGLNDKEESAGIAEAIEKMTMVYKTKPVNLKSMPTGRLHLMVFRLLKCHHFMCMLHKDSWMCVHCRGGFFDQVQLLSIVPRSSKSLS